MVKLSFSGDDFSSFFSEEEILCQTTISDSDELIMEMLKRLAFTRGIGNVPSIFQSLQDREALSASIVSDSIAIPHVRLTSIQRPLVAIATSVNGVRFEKHGHPVQLVILILTPREQPAVYLQIIAALGQILQNVDLAKSVAELATSRDVHRFFERDGMMLPDYVCAGDIMQPVGVRLLDTDSLKDAIDWFVSRELLEIPVVDKEKEMVGLVTAAALLRVCLPDYILWMDDLSPILQFEPFVNILRNEGRTWLAEISTQEFPSVRVDEPAVAVAEALARYNASVCYVLRDKKLVGVITLPHFLEKILRD